MPGSGAKRETINQLSGEFERLARVEKETGLEFWLARELQGVLGCDKWQNLSKVVEKAQIAWKTPVLSCLSRFEGI